MGLRRRNAQASLGVSMERIPKVLIRAGLILSGITNHPAMFASPPVTMATLKGQIDALALAQQLVASRAPGSAAARVPKLTALWTSLVVTRAYVQSVSDASPDNAAAIIEAAGMKLAGGTKYAKPLLSAEVRPGGAVKLGANVNALCQSKDPSEKKKKKGTSRFFSWQYTTNGGQTWSAPVTTNKGRTTIVGLPLMTDVGFRVSVTKGEEQGEWSPTVFVFVH